MNVLENYSSQFISLRSDNSILYYFSFCFFSSSYASFSFPRTKTCCRKQIINYTKTKIALSPPTLALNCLFVTQIKMEICADVEPSIQIFMICNVQYRSTLWSYPPISSSRLKSWKNIPISSYCFPFSVVFRALSNLESWIELCWIARLNSRFLFKFRSAFFT